MEFGQLGSHGSDAKRSHLKDKHIDSQSEVAQKSPSQPNQLALYEYITL
jgi:hypothetical protein